MSTPAPTSKTSLETRPVSGLDRWERHTEWPLAAVAVIFLAVYTVQVLVQPRGPLAHTLAIASAVLYLAFIVDYVARLSLASNRTRWFFHHLFDLAIVALPFLRPLRLLRLAVLLRVLQRIVGKAIRGQVIIYTACSSVLLIYVASLAVLDAERAAPNPDIDHFGEALWWAVVSVTTVGYGDLTPVTATGRVIAVFLMIGGISLVGVVTATLASWIVQRVAEEDDVNQAATSAHINELRADIKRLSDALNGSRLTPEASDQFDPADSRR